MKAYTYELMRAKFKRGDTLGAKALIVNHFNEYIEMVMGKASEPDASMPELACFKNTVPEIKLVTRKKRYPIIFHHELHGITVRLNCIGINERYAYFIHMNNEVHPVQEVQDDYTVTWEEAKSKLSWWDRMMNAITFKKEEPITYPVRLYSTKRIVHNGIRHDFKATAYWFRNAYEDVLKFLGTENENIDFKDYKTYRLLPDQIVLGKSIALTDGPVIDLDKAKLNKRDDFVYYGIKHCDLGVGALYTIAELTARGELTVN